MDHERATIRDDPAASGRDAPLPRAPAVPCAVAAAVGVVFAGALPLPGWLLMTATIAFVAGAAAAQTTGRVRLATAFTILALSGLAAVRTVTGTILPDPVHIFEIAPQEPVPVRLRGVVATAPVIRNSQQDAFTPPWMRSDRTVCEVVCTHVCPQAGTLLPVRGRIRLQTTGHLLHVDVGERVELFGTLRFAEPPRNPGEFDFQAWLKGEGISAVVHCETPDAIRSLGLFERGGVDPHFWRSHIRQRLRTIMGRSVRPGSLPVAVSLFLGDRTGMPTPMRDDFAASGMMHLLAISGLHVGIFAGLVLIVCRVLRTGPAGTALLVIVCVWSFAFITEFRPPVVRASVLTTIVVFGWSAGLQGWGMNSLAVSAIVLLFWNPNNLFEPGPQLSFLAVIAILTAGPLLTRITRPRPSPLAPERGPLWRLLEPAVRWMLASALLTCAIWFYTVPRASTLFHLIAPIGILLNILLVPAIAVVLALGFAFLGCGVLLPEIAWLPGWLFGTSLDLLLWIVHEAAGIDAGQMFIPGPSNSWLLVFYTLLLIASGLVPVRLVRRWAWRGVAVWFLSGLLLALQPPARESFRCTFLSVGHGGAVLIECPNGKTLLYDAGMFGYGRVAARTIQDALAARGIYRLDGVILSHADVDHFNGLPHLLPRVPIGSVMVHPTFFDPDQPAVNEASEALVRHGSVIRTVFAGDRLQVGEGVQARLLHPSAEIRDGSDNENSLVLELSVAGRIILLTGDIERVGLDRLTRLPARRIDVLMSPHHGSIGANTAPLARWADARSVVLSTRDLTQHDKLRDVYGPDVTLYSTAVDGAVTVTVNGEGKLQISTFRGNDSRLGRRRVSR
ncbi:ComEC family competence protein [Maioricimonas rarisocia]|uniref:ComEC family competence protein n=1 Tax=Maioricimonas rarisocia TaxID=2528026 RepID=A0A517Z2Z0_9PLAN|nr:ComEC/Rec2 family competence protein [Maioricimonas rarisocia]QDU36831.1 ComEC family competence protein [Maioricimonas rarisocia]